MFKRKLLLADDSVTIQKVINLTFADEGIEVMTVGDGDAAMERFYEFRPDIVLADVNMPGTNGYRICENLRQREDSANIPVILLVGSFESFDENEARRVGANDWITKPFQSIRQLVSRVTELLDQPVVSNGGHHPVPAHGPESTDLLKEAHQPGKEDDDIDDLYRQSIAKTVELPGGFRHDLALGDTGMDDDMIETSYVGANTDTVEMKEFELSVTDEANDFVDTLPEPSEATFELTPEILVTDSETPNAGDFRPPEVENRSPVWEESKEPEAFQKPFVSENEVEKGFDLQGEAEPEIVVEPTAPIQEVQPGSDDFNLLEIPTAVTAGSSAGAEEEEIVTLGDKPATENLAHLSPEFIDAVARKVIEKISENVIRQIAWQVVPQVVESVLREKERERSN